MFTCPTLLLFSYPVPADIHGSVQHVTLYRVPVDVLPRLSLWFSQVKHYECHHIHPPQEVQCVHMYSVAWDVLVICTNDYLTETGWELGRRGGGAVWGKLGGARESCVCRGGGAVHGSCLGELHVTQMCVEDLCGGAVYVRAMWVSHVGGDLGKLCVGNCGGSCVHSCLVFLIHSQKCTICYSVHGMFQ